MTANRNPLIVPSQVVTARSRTKQWNPKEKRNERKRSGNENDNRFKRRQPRAQPHEGQKYQRTNFDWDDPARKKSDNFLSKGSAS
jgi:hypothetical protein